MAGLADLPNQTQHIGSTIGIMSGKGGVGKSTTTALLACALARAGKSVGILDTDITGSTIPTLFGITEKAKITIEEGIQPTISTDLGIKIAGLDLLLADSSQPFIWRGPMVSSVLVQLMAKTHWGDLDFLLLDLPPGTSDVPLTIMQQGNVSAFLVVTSPSMVALPVVEKSMLMATQMNKPLLGIVENQAYFVCAQCDKKHFLFGESIQSKLTSETHPPYLGGIPFSDVVMKASAGGKIETVVLEEMETLAKSVIAAAPQKDRSIEGFVGIDEL